MSLLLRKVETRAFALIVLAMGVGHAAAQDRMPPIPGDKMTEAQKHAVQEFIAARGASGISGPFVPLLRSPEVMTRLRAVGDYVRFKSALPPRLSELVILLTAREWTQQYEWNAHYEIATKAGLSTETAKAVAEGRRPARMAEEEEIVYDLCLELQRNKGVSDATYARALAKFGEQGIIDTVGIMAYYTTIAMVMNAARTPLPPGVTPPLAPFPR